MPSPSPFLIEIPAPPDAAAWLAHARAQHAAAWLDGDGGATPRGRFTFLTWNPHRVLRAWGDRIVDEHWTPGGGCRRTAAWRGDPLEALAGFLAEESAEPAVSPPVPWASGAVLALSFELADWIERLSPVPRGTGPHAATPDLHAAAYDSCLVIDETRGRTWVAGRRSRGRRPSGVLSTLDLDHLEGVMRRTSAWTEPPPLAARRAPRASAVPTEYSRAIAAIREHLRAGDVYQVNFSRAVRAPWPRPALELFLAHRRLGRVPHGAYLDLGDRAVASFSPERFLAVRGRHATTCPIKGTRPRGATPAADRQEIERLCASAKDHAEHIMIVDLERNDLGRVCVPGSIHVDPLLAVESYASVHHLVSTVQGTLRAGVRPVDLLRATFPGGSITGAPKIRAIEILRALEAEPRRLYTGAIGIWDAGGDLDLGLAIRTALVAGGELEYRVGGGIVIDSDPAAEYEETGDKARALELVLEASPELAAAPAAAAGPA